MRLDENGQRFRVAGALSAEDADRLLKDYEAKGHKQTYWKEPDTGE